MRPTLALTATLAAILALLAAACTSGDPTGATPPPEATTPTPSSTPPPTSTPERTPTPEPTPEIIWTADGLPFGVPGPLIVLREAGGDVVVVTPAGDLVSLVAVGRSSVMLSGLRLVVVEFPDRDLRLFSLDGTLLAEPARPRTQVLSAAGSDDGELILWVSIPRDRDDTTFFFREATLYLLDRDGEQPHAITQADLPFEVGYVLRVARWLPAVSAFAVSAGLETEAEPEWVLIQPDGDVTPAPRAFLWFSQPGGHYAYAVEGEGCLLINGAEIVAEAVGGAEVFRIVGNDDERLTPSAISPDGTEVLVESRRFDPDDTDCAWAESPPDLYLATIQGDRTPVDDPRPIFERWGVLPPFDADCIDIGYTFCHHAETVDFTREGLLYYGDPVAHIVFLGTVDLPPP